MEKDILNRKFELILIGGSAGSLEVIIHMLPKLRVTNQLPILVVLHRKAGDDSGLIDLLNIKTGLQVKEAEEKDQLLPGVVYIAPADYHLLIENDKTISLDYSEKENYSRPSIDITFVNAADIFGPSLLAILLSGANADGTEGLLAVKKSGGYIVVQDPVTAYSAYMPKNALTKVKADQVLPAEDIAGLINGLAG